MTVNEPASAIGESRPAGVGPGNDLEPTMNVPSRPWNALSLPAELTTIRAMLSHEEKQYLTWLTADRFEGWGAIVDLGPWLGGSSAMLAEGLKRQGKRNKISSFDLFRWDPSYMEALAPENLKEGTDFRHLFVREVGDYISWIDLQKLDLMNASWNGGPIEILFVDAAKTWELTNAIFRGFGPHLVPGRSRVVLQDFRHHTTHWLPLIFDSRPDIWKEAESVADGCTTTFIPLRPLDGLAGIHPDYAEESFPLESSEQLLRGRMDRESPANQQLFLRTLYKKYLLEGGPLDEVQKLRDQVLAGGVTSEDLSSIEDIHFSLVPWGWRAYAKADYRTAQLLAERCLAVNRARPVYAVALLGMSLLRLGDLEGARRCIEECATRHPDVLLARLYQAELANVEGRYDAAEADARRVLEGSQGDEFRIEYSVSVLEQAWSGADRMEQAEDALRDLLSVGALAESPLFLTHVAREQFRHGHRDEGMQNVEKALEKAPGHELASRLRDEWTSSQVTQTDAAVPPAPQREPVADEIPALVEMTRRLETSTEELRAASQQQLDALHQATATAALQAGKLVKLTEQSSAEQKQIDTLTQRIERLIAVMTRLTIVAALVGGMLTISVLVQLYRWWRG